MRRLRLYLDTSVWNFLFADDAPEKKKCTEILFSEIKAGKHSIFISTEVEKEISVAPIRKRQLLAATLERCRPLVFDHTEESRSLVYSYMSKRPSFGQASCRFEHIALASINENGHTCKLEHETYSESKDEEYRQCSKPVKRISQHRNLDAGRGDYLWKLKNQTQ